jgi:hypothetical protein
MRFDFGTPFLKIMPPDTNFGEAWESLCYQLLVAERGLSGLLRLAPPDCGVDILDQAAKDAFQCKATEAGASGTMPPQSSISSLTTAVAHRAGLQWQKYYLATNSQYTGDGLEKLRAAAATLGVAADELQVLGPDHWDELCSRHYTRIKHMFDYRVTLAEKEVIEAFRGARYYDNVVTEYAAKLQQGGYRITVTNNRTPLELDIPFSPLLSVENCVDVAMQLLGLSTDWTSFKDIDASAGPSISLSIDRKALDFGKTLQEVGIGPTDKVELWITIVWRDGQRQAIPSSDVLRRMAYSELFIPRLNVENRGAEAVRREEHIVQGMIWQSVARLLSPN